MNTLFHNECSGLTTNPNTLNVINTDTFLNLECRAIVTLSLGGR